MLRLEEQARQQGVGLWDRVNFHPLFHSNVDMITTVEGSNVVRKSNDDVINDTLDDYVQATPHVSDIYSEFMVDKTLGVPMKPTSKQVLNSWSRMKFLQTPTSFSHRRLFSILVS